MPRLQQIHSILQSSDWERSLRELPKKQTPQSKDEQAQQKPYSNASTFAPSTSGIFTVTAGSYIQPLLYLEKQAFPEQWCSTPVSQAHPGQLELVLMNLFSLPLIFFISMYANKN